MNEDFEIKTSLTDVADNSKTMDVTLIRKNGTITIRPEGYSDCNSADGCGEPIYLELYNGRLLLHVWADINREDPTHSIDMERAKESNRKSNQKE